MFCGYCGNNIPEGKKFCNKDGKPAGEGLKFCTKTGQLHDTTKQYCGKCGKKVSSLPHTPPLTPVNPIKVSPVKPQTATQPKPVVQRTNATPPNTEQDKGKKPRKRSRLKGKKVGSIVGDKRRVTIPKEIYNLLHLEAGHTLVFIIQEDRIAIELPESP